MVRIINKIVKVSKFGGRRRALKMSKIEGHLESKKFERHSGCKKFGRHLRWTLRVSKI